MKTFLTPPKIFFFRPKKKLKKNKFLNPPPKKKFDLKKKNLPPPHFLPKKITPASRWPKATSPPEELEIWEHSDPNF